MGNVLKLIRLALQSSLTILIFAGTAYPEQIQGNLKSLAAEAKVFTMESAPGKVFFVSYNSATRWQNLQSPAELAIDDFLAVEFTRKNEQLLATSIAKAVASAPAGITAITTEKLAATLDHPSKELPFLLIDPRPVEHFDAAHLPGAVSIPLSRLEKRSPGLLPEDKTVPLLFYDRGAGGGEAAKSAAVARAAGYTSITIYPDGIAGWLKSGRIAVSSAAFIRKTSPPVIDLRDESLVASGHLPGAVNIPANGLAAMSGMFPKDKRSPLVLYGESDQQSLAAARTIKGWGHRNVTIFMGGITSWLGSAEVLSVEPAEKYIYTTNKTHSGQLSSKDFEMALSSPAMIEIVDVRSSADFNRGSFPACKHIPLQELPLRYGELAKDRIQVIFGADAERAEMAFDFLHQRGYRLSFLNGSVEFGADGKYQFR